MKLNKKRQIATIAHDITTIEEATPTRQAWGAKMEAKRASI